MKPLSKIKEILKGIDEEESSSDVGWWETSTGAEFGKQKLEEIEKVLSTKCKWVFERGDYKYLDAWMSECGKRYMLPKGDAPKDLDFSYCPICGRAISPPETHK